jgi:hypothetical protein
MQATKLSTYLSDPLAGCLDILKEESNSLAMMRALFLRMRLFYSEKVCSSLSDQIISEADSCTAPRYQYIINETLYELRRAGKEFSEQYETVILNQWMSILMKEALNNDSVLDIIIAVKRNRKKRKR